MLTPELPMLTPERKQQINEMCGAISLRLRRDEVRKDDLAVLLILIAECQGEADAHRQMVSALTARLAQMEAAIRWALGEEDLEPPKDGKGPRYWWRRQLRSRAGLDGEPTP